MNIGSITLKSHTEYFGAVKFGGFFLNYTYRNVKVMLHWAQKLNF